MRLKNFSDNNPPKIERFINSSDYVIVTKIKTREKMKSNLSLIFALVTLLLIPGVLADLQVVSSDTFTAVHNSLISIPFTLSNTGNLVTNLAINITSLTNSSQIISVPISDPSKTSINASSSLNYSIDNYPIAQYTVAGSYPVTISVAGNESGTPVSATKSITITVNQTKLLEASPSSLSVSAIPGTTQKTALTIKNSGNVNLTNIVFAQSTAMQDNDNDTITLSLTSTSSLSTLQPGQTVTIDVEANVPSNEDYDTYNTNIAVNSSEGVSVTVPYSISVSQSFCDKGRKGSYFETEITEPDGGDDFYPNDIIPVEVKVRNNDDEERDVVIAVNLFDATDGEFLDEKVETDGSIEDDTTEYFSLDLKVPVDVKDHTYRVYAKAYEDGEEETQCVEDYVTIDIKKETHDVVIDKVEIPDSVNCGESADVKITLANIGKRDEDVKVKVSNPELKTDEEKTLTIDKEDKKTVVIPFKIPQDATKGNHSLKIQAFFHLSNDAYQNSVTETYSVDVQGDCIVEEPNLVLTSEVLDTPYIGQQFTVKLNLFNTGDKKANYAIIASGYESWARLDKIEPAILTIEPSQTTSVYIYLTPLNTTTGTKNLHVKVTYGEKKIEKDIGVEINEKVSAPQAYQGFVTKISNLSGLDLITVNAILVIAIILILMWIIRVRRTY